MKNLKIENRGRAPIGPKAMTSAERQRRYRIRVKASGKAGAKDKPTKRPKSAFDWATVQPISGAAWQECCRKTPGMTVPDIEACEAHALWVSNVALAMAASPPVSILGTTKATLRQLLRQLPALTERFRAAEKSTQPHDSYPHLERLLGVKERGLTRDGYPHMGRLEACDQLENGARYLLNLYADDGATDWHDLVGPICVCAMGRRQTSVHHDGDPLCIFVRLILDQMGVTGPSLHNISAVLRGRRGRRARKSADRI